MGTMAGVMVFVTLLFFLSGWISKATRFLSISTSNALEVKYRFEELVNTFRAQQGMRILQNHHILTQIAQEWADQQATQDRYRAHEGFDRRARKAMKWNGLPWGSVGENCAMNRGHSDPARCAFQGLIASPNHRKSILTFRFVGTGVSRSASGSYYFVQFFGN